MKPRSALSSEPILLGPVSHRIEGEETDPSAYVVEVAFVAPAGEQPSAWTLADWETSSTNGSPSWWVRVGIGPLSLVGQLEPGDHRAYVRISVSGTERPVLDAGLITII